MGTERGLIRNRDPSGSSRMESEWGLSADSDYADAIDVAILKREQARINAEVADAESQLAREKLAQAKQIIDLALDLAKDCAASYHKARPEVRKMWNGAFFHTVRVRSALSPTSHTRSPSRPCSVHTRARWWASSLPRHADEHRPERPILLAVDEQLGEGAALRVAPELADPLGALEVREHEDVEQLGAGSGTERVETGLEPPFEFVWTRRWTLAEAGGPSMPYRGSSSWTRSSARRRVSMTFRPARCWSYPASPA